jgi:CRISPR-associated protein (Cas_csx3)
MIRLSVIKEDDFTWLFIEVRGKKPDRVDLLHLDYPAIAGTKGLVMSCGKVPYWTVTPIASQYRNLCRWQAMYDAEEKGAIVTTSFEALFRMGHFIPLKLPCLICRKEGGEKCLKAGAVYPYCSEHQNHALERQVYKKIKIN